MRCINGSNQFCSVMQLIKSLKIDYSHDISGTDVVIVKSGRRICGTGGCIANAPLHQNKSYFEFKIQSTGKTCASIYCMLTNQLSIVHLSH